MIDLLKDSHSSCRRAIALCVLVLLTSSAVCQEDVGKYIGVVKTEWLKDGREMRLLEEFTYVDPKGVEWKAPAGSKIDGASIPQAGWSLVGGPFEGKYREASVIHDVACDEKSRPWEEAHEAFYWAMLASGVETWRAKAMYGAVYHKGPRWPKVVSQISRFRPFSRSKELQGSRAVALEQALKGEPPGTKVEIVDEKPTSGKFSTRTEYLVRVTPPASKLNDGDVEGLTKRIREREKGPKGGLTLEEIRNVKPGR